jgi:hypothetical protein
MASKGFSFRLPDEAVQQLELLKYPDETINQVAQRLLLEKLGLHTEESTKVQTSIVDDLRSEIEQLRSQLQLPTPLSTELHTSVSEDLQSQIEQLRSQLQLSTKLNADVFNDLRSQIQQLESKLEVKLPA